MPHPSITLDRIMTLIDRDDYTGLCLRCGAEQDGCEPDARRYVCAVCGAQAVYGAEELVFHVGA